MTEVRFAFVLEQTLGHVAHSRNIERALAQRLDIQATVIKLGFDSARAIRRLPGLKAWSFRASWTARSSLHQMPARGSPDAAFIHTQVAALLAGRFMRSVPTVVSLDATPVNYDSQGEAYEHRRQPEPIERFKRSVNRLALREARHLVTWCEWAKHSLVTDYELPADHIAVIHPGVDQTLFRPRPRRRPGPPRILFVGGSFERKGGYDLLEALDGLETSVELDIVTAAHVAALDARRGVRVHIGLRPQSEPLVELYRQADLFVLPSRGDCFPQAIAEAMACGIPVVAADVGAISEMVKDGRSGYLVPPRSPVNLRRALGRLLADPTLRRAMGRESFQIATHRHDARRNCNAIFELMRGIMAERPRRP